MDQNTITRPDCVLAVPTITTEIHDEKHMELTFAAIGSVVHDMATVTGTQGITPTGTVSFTVYTNQTCSGTGASAGEVTLDSVGVADPSDSAILTRAGLSYRAHYNGDAVYDEVDGPCEVLVSTPTAVELLYFQANRLDGQQVLIEWATALEVDNFGFNLYRASVDDLEQASLVHFEPAVDKDGDSSTTYSYTDIAPGNTSWWYWLADLDNQGYEAFHAPVVNVPLDLNIVLPYQIYMPLIRKGTN